jgi:phosphopantetheine adenylyltransferase
MSLWNKKVHVKSSLPTKNGQFSMFIGRWQPLHEGHKRMFQQVLDGGGNVLIAIRDNEQVDVKNPFTSFEVMGNIMDEYKEMIDQKRVRVIIIPDICSVNFGRGVGYDIIEHIPPDDIAEISATKIREKMLLETKGKSGL